MANNQVSNKVLEWFARDAPSTELTAFAANFLVSPLNLPNYKSTDIKVLQGVLDPSSSGNKAWNRGLFISTIDAIVTDPSGNTKSVKVPIANELNAIFKAFCESLCYLKQSGGISEYLNTQDYYINSLVRQGSILYISRTGTNGSPNIGNALPVAPNTSNTNWQVFYDPAQFTILATSISQLNQTVTQNDSSYHNIFFLKDGSQAFGGDLPMGNHKITGVAAGTVGSDVATVGQIPVIIPNINPKSFAVNWASQDANGNANFAIKASASTILINATARTIKSTYADGTQAPEITVNKILDTSSLADTAVNDAWIYCVENGTDTFILNSKILYVNALPASGSAGQYVVLMNPLSTWKWETSSNSWVKANFVRYTEFQIAAGGIVTSSVRNYAINQLAYIEVPLSLGYIFNHNLGILPQYYRVMVKLKSLVSNANFTLNATYPVMTSRTFGIYDGRVDTASSCISNETINSCTIMQNSFLTILDNTGTLQQIGSGDSRFNVCISCNSI